MLSLDPLSLSKRENYKLLIGSVIPRPIALVTTLSEQGVLNAAPFSFFSIVSSEPPMLSVSVQRKQGAMKDTARNAIASGALVIHIVDESLVEAANETAVPLPPEESEVSRTGLTPIASETILVPGILEARIRMECVLEQAIPLGNPGAAPASDLLIARVTRYHLQEELWDESGVRADKLNAVSRLAGDDYGRIGEVFSLKRPE